MTSLQVSRVSKFIRLLGSILDKLNYNSLCLFCSRQSLYILTLGETVPSLSGLRLMSTCKPILSPMFPQQTNKQTKTSLGLPLPKSFPSLCYKNAHVQWVHRAYVGVSFPWIQFGMQVSPSQGSAFIHLIFFPSPISSLSSCTAALPRFLIPLLLNIVRIKQQCLRNESKRSSGHSDGIRVPVGWLLTVLFPSWHLMPSRLWLWWEFCWSNVSASV